MGLTVSQMDAAWGADFKTALSAALSEVRLPDADGQLREKLQQRLDGKTKPRGSLGRLEELALQLGLILNTTAPVLEQPQVVIFAGDHGLAARGVSAFPSDVTWQMVQNFLAGGACISVLSKQHGLALQVADCGVAHDFPPVADGGAEPLRCKVAAGTQDSSQGVAMTVGQCGQAMLNGMRLVEKLPGNVLLPGEMGIGNTSAAALIMAKLLHLPVAACAGAGTGLDSEQLTHKVAVLETVMQRHSSVTEPLAVLAAVGGFEIATMTGAILQAAAERRVIVVDGFIATAAVLVAHALAPAVAAYCVFSHQSDEQAHGRMLQHLNATPLLQLGLRLGEGSGAALAWPLLQSACVVLNEMASFGQAGVSEQVS